MKANLMFRERDFDAAAPRCIGSETLLADLELGRILECMAGDDKTVRDVCEAALFQMLEKPEEIMYR